MICKFMKPTYTIYFTRQLRITMRRGKDEKYSSHQPLLISVARVMEIRRVVEFGSGLFSTTLFLDTNHFPHLQSLLSFEDNPEWFAKIVAEIVPQEIMYKTHLYKSADGNEKCRMCCCSEKDALLLSAECKADLVFVDGTSPKWRNSTAIHAKKIAPLVVMHDAENRRYSEAINAFKYRFLYKKRIPYTALLSDTIDLEELIK